MICLIVQRRAVPEGDNETVILGPWIGLDDRFQRTVLRWADGCRPKETDVLRWAPGEPKLRHMPGTQSIFNEMNRWLLWDRCRISLSNTIFVCRQFLYDIWGAELENRVGICNFKIFPLENPILPVTCMFRVSKLCSYGVRPNFVRNPQFPVEGDEMQWFFTIFLRYWEN